MRGCFSETKRPIIILDDGTKLFRCPIKYISPDISRLIALYSMYAKGVLLYEGGLSEQPALYTEAMVIIESQIKEYEHKQLLKNSKGR